MRRLVRIGITDSFARAEPIPTCRVRSDARFASLWRGSTTPPPAPSLQGTGAPRRSLGGTCDVWCASGSPTLSLGRSPFLPAASALTLASLRCGGGVRLPHRPPRSREPALPPPSLGGDVRRLVRIGITD